MFSNQRRQVHAGPDVNFVGVATLARAIRELFVPLRGILLAEYDTVPEHAALLYPPIFFGRMSRVLSVLEELHPSTVLLDSIVACRPPMNRSCVHPYPSFGNSLLSQRHIKIFVLCSVTQPSSLSRATIEIFRHMSLQLLCEIVRSSNIHD